jgi:hypothetical protein
MKHLILNLFYCIKALKNIAVDAVQAHNPSPMRRTAVADLTRIASSKMTPPGYVTKSI